MDSIYRARRGSVNKEQGEPGNCEGDPYCIFSYNNFIFIDNFILFCKRCLFSVILMIK